MSLMRRALRLIDHLSQNSKDIHNRRQLELCESKIRRFLDTTGRTVRLTQIGHTRGTN